LVWPLRRKYTASAMDDALEADDALEEGVL
jgi:hypothetical protein